jgi:pimeloyl-ACP methyl ester carboxylesterase
MSGDERHGHEADASGPEGSTGPSPVAPPRPALVSVDRPAVRPIRKDETDLPDRGVHIESWLPERRSRRRPMFFIHGELAGSWVWERFLGYFAGRGWEGHALNLRGHYWAPFADLAELTFDLYVEDAAAAAARLSQPTVVGHGLGCLIALKLAEQVPVGALVLVAPPLPAPLRPPVKPHQLREVPDVFRQDHLGWQLPPQLLRRQYPDLTLADAMRIRHMLAAESGPARREMLSGVAVDTEALPPAPRLVIAGGVDPERPVADVERVARWLDAQLALFPEHSHYGLVVGEHSHVPVAERIRSFLEQHRL